MCVCTHTNLNAITIQRETNCPPDLYYYYCTIVIGPGRVVHSESELQVHVYKKFSGYYSGYY